MKAFKFILFMVVPALLIAGVFMTLWTAQYERPAAVADTAPDPVRLVMPLTMQYEGLRLKAYYGPDGFPHIGYGHLLEHRHGAPLDRYPDITEARARELLAGDLRKAQNAVRRFVRAALNPYQEAALIDLAFNIGASAFENSTLVRDLNAGDTLDVPHQFKRWVYAGGHEYEGLTERRRAEVELWNHETKTAAPADTADGRVRVR